MIEPDIQHPGGARGLPDLHGPAELRRVLDAVDGNFPVARVVDRLADELTSRLRTDAQDLDGAAPDELVASRYRLLASMAHRYRSAAGRESRPGRLTACLMLAAVHQVANSRQVRMV